LIVEPARVQQSISHTHCRDGFSYSHERFEGTLSRFD